MLRHVLAGFLIVVVGLLLAACQSTQAASAPTPTVTEIGLRPDHADQHAYAGPGSFDDDADG